MNPDEVRWRWRGRGPATPENLSVERLILLGVAALGFLLALWTVPLQEQAPSIPSAPFWELWNRLGTVLLLRLGVGKPGAGLLLAWQELPTYAAFLGLAWWQLRGLQERGIHLLRAPLAWALALNPVLLLGAPPWRGVGIVLALLAATEIGLGGIGSLICRRRRG